MELGSLWRRSGSERRRDLLFAFFPITSEAVASLRGMLRTREGKGGRANHYPGASDIR